MTPNTLRELAFPLSEKEIYYRDHPDRRGEFFEQYPGAFLPDEDGIVTIPMRSSVQTNLRIQHGAIVPMPPHDFCEEDTIAFNKQTRFSEVPLHRHTYVEMNYVWTGRCTAVANGKTFELAQGDVMIMDRNVIHTILPTGEGDLDINCSMSPQYFTANFLEQLAAGGPIPRFLGTVISQSSDHDRYLLFHTADLPLFNNIFEEMLCEYLEPGICQVAAVNSYMKLIFIQLARCYQGAKETEYRDSRQSYPTEILRYMSEHCLDCSLKEVAEHFGYHPNYLSRMLKEATGTNFKDLIAEGRLAHAAQLLITSEDTVSEIAHACGYTNQSFFYQKFEERYDCPPAEYRKKYS